MVDEKWQPRHRRGVVVRHDGVRNRSMVLQPERLATLNETAARILELCDGERTVAGIVAALSAAYPGAASAEIVAAVDRFLEAALNEGWLE